MLSYDVSYWLNQYKEEKGTRESVSGVGSTLANTTELRAALPVIFYDYKIKTIIDIPCGDWNWMQKVDLSGKTYLGCDVVPDMIALNNKRYGSEDVSFCVRDALTDYSVADLIICRDFLFHLSDANIKKVLSRFRAKWLLLTSFPGCIDEDLNGLWRKIDVERFGTGKPIYQVQENSSPACLGRIVGLYKGVVDVD